jgi:hypothetical protein
LFPADGSINFVVRLLRRNKNDSRKCQCESANRYGSGGGKVRMPPAKRRRNALSRPTRLSGIYTNSTTRRKSPFFQTKNRALVDKYFDKNLADTIWKDAKDSKAKSVRSEPIRCITRKI